MSTTTVHHGLRRRTLAWLSIAALLAVSIVATTTSTAHADDHWDFSGADVWPQPESEDDPFEDVVPTFYYWYDELEGEDCELDVAVYPYPVRDLEDPQPIDTTIEAEELEDGFGALTFPDLGAGWYDIQVATCTEFEDDEPIGETALFAPEGFGFAILQVTKDVEGDVPDDATFLVEAACEYDDVDFEWSLEDTYEREFGPEGGSAEIVLYPWLQYFDINCELSETDDGGAESSTIENAEIVILGEDLYDPESDEFNAGLFEHTTTVTNTFPEAEEPEEEDEEDEGDVEDDVDEVEAPPAEAVEAEPDYTG